MADDVILGIRFVVDGKEISAEVRSHEEAFKRFGREGADAYDKARRANDQARASAEHFTGQLKRQAETLGLTRSQTLAYDAAQHKLTDAQRRGVAESIRAIDAYDRKQHMLGRVRLAAASAGAALTAMAIGGLKATVAATIDAEQSSLRLEAVLRATGHAAGFSKAKLDEMAETMKSRFGIDDDEMRDAMAKLATFRKVSGESFGEALEVAVNLSRVFKTDLQGAIVQLGKALEDPVGGLDALTRSGVTFEASQERVIKKLIETGRHGEAITAVLTAMKEQGLDKVAESMNRGLFKATNDLKLEWGDMLKALGKSESALSVTHAALELIRRDLEAIKNIAKDDAVGGALGGPVTGTIRGATPPLRARDFGGESELEYRIRELNAQLTSGATKNLAARLKEQDAYVKSLKDEAATLGMTAEQAKLYKAEQLGIAGAQLQVVRTSVTRLAQYRAEEELLRGNAAAMEAQAKRVADNDAAYTSLHTAYADQLGDIRREAELLGVSDRARAQTIELLKIERAEREAIGKLDPESGGYSERVADITRAADIQRRQVRDAVDARETAREVSEQAKKNAEEQKRYNDEIGRSLTDALLRGFEAGKGFGRNFRDSLENTFKTLVLRPVIQFILSPISAAIGAGFGGLGIPGLGNAAGLGGAAAGMGSAYGGGLTGGITAFAAGADSIFQNIGVSTGSQFLADIGNYGMGVPVLGGALMMASGNVAGGAGTMIGGAIGSAFGPVGTVVGSALGGMIGSALGRKKKKPALTGYNVQGTVSAEASDLALYSAWSNGAQRLAAADWDPGRPFGNSVADVYARAGALGERLGLDTSRLGPVSINTSAQDLGDILERVSDELAMQLLPNLKDFARIGESASQTLARVAQAGEQMQGVVRALPGQLGITALEQYRDSLKVSEFLSPLERLGAAQTLLGETYARARGGDLTAVQSFPQLLQSSLAIGRDVYASGPQFAELMVEGNRKLNDLLVQQQGLQADILQDIPITIIEKANDQIAAIKAQTATLNEALIGVREELSRIRAEIMM